MGGEVGGEAETESGGGGVEREKSAGSDGNRVVFEPVDRARIRLLLSALGSS